MPANQSKPRGTHLDFDGAWPADALGLPCVDLRAIGPSLRTIARAEDVEGFARRLGPDLPPFVLYGSGDFHHLTAALLRRIAGPVTVMSFDNHPDWDVRPPRWSCGGWVNRALELPQVKRIVVWGCGNFELAMPSRVFAPRRALRSGRLEIRPWAERQPASVRRWLRCVTREDWREQFSESLTDDPVYVTVDLDCLSDQQATTNWENGLFSADDVAWAITQVRQRTRIVGGDVCGAYSVPRYARPTQRFAGWWDHPKLPATSESDAREMNLRSLRTIWPALTGGD